MKKDLFLIGGLVLFILALLIAGKIMGFSGLASPSLSNKATDGTKTSVSIKDLSIDAEIASTTDSQTKGLSDRANLPTGRGMLFIYDDESSRSFWMKNVSFPLDIIWIDSNYKIVGIDRNIQTELGKSDSELAHYGQAFQSQYVLEINGGTASKNNIQIGDTAHFVLP